MKSLRKTILATGAAIVSLAAVSSQASAGLVVITDWDYSVTTNFTSATWDDFGPAGIQLADSANTPTVGGVWPGSGVINSQVLSWGDNTGADFTAGGRRSALTLDIGNPALGAVVTNGGPTGATSQITHWNNVISDGADELATALIQSTLTLDPTSPDLPALPTLPGLSFDIRFAETPNGNNNPCPDGTFGGQCADIFVIENPSSLSQQFSIGQITYLVEIVPLSGSLVDLPATACAAAVASNPCIGFTTPENQASSLAFGFQISQVPEPGTLSLMGLGLVGGAVLRRRKKVA